MLIKRCKKEFKTKIFFKFLVIIERFLCRVPNENKYVHKHTAEILHRSASEFKEFSGYKASKGWAAIAQYASNLFAQPWRKEYKSLKV